VGLPDQGALWPCAETANAQHRNSKSGLIDFIENLLPRCRDTIVCVEDYARGGSASTGDLS
jgi:hypothetical protein